MALIDEEIIQEWLHRKGFLTIRGLKHGNKEIDLLAIRLTDNISQYWHIEAQISFNPIGHIGGDGAAHQTEEVMQSRIQGYVDRKYNNPTIIALRESIANGVEWKKVFLYARAAFPYEVECFKNLGIEVIEYGEILRSLMSDEHGIRTSSVAGNIVDILKYARDCNL